MNLDQSIVSFRDVLIACQLSSQLYYYCIEPSHLKYTAMLWLNLMVIGIYIHPVFPFSPKKRKFLIWHNIACCFTLSWETKTHFHKWCSHERKYYFFRSWDENNIQSHTRNNGFSVYFMLLYQYVYFFVFDWKHVVAKCWCFHWWYFTVQ